MTIRKNGKQFKSAKYLLEDFANSRIQSEAVKLIKKQKREISEFGLVNLRLQGPNLELRQLKEEADLASKAKYELLSVISHEIRNPLNPIVNLSAILLEGNPKTMLTCTKKIKNGNFNKLKGIENFNG